MDKNNNMTVKTEAEKRKFGNCHCQTREIHLIEILKDIRALIHHGRLDQVEELIKKEAYSN